MNEIIDDLQDKDKPRKKDFACIDCPLAIWQASSHRSICHCQKVFKITFDSNENYNFEFEKCSAKNDALRVFDHPTEQHID